ncbi:MAG: TrbC/VirB2 family protein [Pseudomonadales bacterium]
MKTATVHLSHRALIVFASVSACLLIPEPVLAAGAAMPYDTALTNILNSLTGTVARVAGAIAILLFGLGLAFSEGGGMLKKAIGILFGLTIAFNAVSWGLTFFGFAGGLVV